MEPKRLILAVCLMLASRSDSASQLIVKGFNGFDNYRSMLSPLTVELGYGHAGAFFQAELLSGFGFRERKLDQNERSYAEKTRLIPIEANLLIGKFGEGGNTPYFGLGYQYLFYEYDSFGETFESDGFLIPLIFGYQSKISSRHALEVSFEKPIFSNLEFDQVSFTDVSTAYKSSYEPAAGLDDIEIVLAYKFAFR